MKAKSPTPRTPAQRKQDERDRHRIAGRTAVVHSYVHPADRARVTRYVQRVNKARFSDA